MNDITFVNLTDIDITLETLDKVIIELPRNFKNFRQLPKVSHETIKVDTVGRMPYDVRFKREVKNLPPPRPGVIYIVSGMISEVAERPDVLTPSGVGALEVKGNVKAYRKLVRYSRTGRTQ